MSALTLFKKSLKSTISSLPFGMQRKLSKAKVFFPYYHLVSDERVPHCVHCCSYPNIKKFLSDLDFFLKYFEPITLRQLLGYLRNEENLPTHPLLLSFDDGYRELYDIVFPILRRKGVPAAFFVNTRSLDNKDLIFDNKLSLLKEHLIKANRLTTTERQLCQLDYSKAQQLEELCIKESLDTESYLRTVRPYLTSAQLGEMNQLGVEIGSHSIDHPPFASLSLAEQVRQTFESLEFLKQRFSLDYSAFAFPGTDSGVSAEFFSTISSRVDVSFGTASGKTDPVPTHFQRISFEYSRDPAELVLAERYGVELVRRLTGRNVVKRSSYAAG
jgi:peptidoglycan/xylan/chitin deacetylase (PgdA/CDA1 family)